MIRRPFKVAVGLMLSLFVANTIYSQQAVFETGNGILEYYSLKAVEHNSQLSYEEILGNAYETERFQIGKVYLLDGKVLENELINYNRYSDQFEVMRNDKKFSLYSNDEILQIEYNGQTFYPKSFLTKKNKKAKGFLKELRTGECTLYKRHLVEFQGETVAYTSYETKKQARFEEQEERYFIQFGEEAPFEIICYFSRKKFSKYFNKSAEQIENFMKEESLRAKNEKDLIKIIDYFNSLQSNDNE